MKKVVKALALVTLIAMLSMLLPIAAGAAKTSDSKKMYDLDKECSLNLTYAYNGVGFEALNISVYKVADGGADFSYTVCEEFSDCNFDIENFTEQSDYSSLALTLAGFIAENNKEATCEAATDKDGNVVLSNLSAGIYYVAPVKTQDAKGSYSFQSFCVALPNVDENGEWIYNVSANPKSCEFTKADVLLRLNILWDDKGAEDLRPEEVTVNIYKDGELYKTVKIGKDNNWTYTWKTKDDTAMWSFAETDINTRYAVTVKQSSNTYSIINSYTPEKTVVKTGDSMALLIAAAAVTVIAGSAVITVRKLKKSKYE